MHDGPPDVVHEERVAGEDEPGLLRPATAIGDDVGVVRRRVARRRHRGDERVPELDQLTVVERAVWEVDLRARREVRGGAGGRHELGETRDVVGLDVGLEHGHDLAGRRRALDVGLDQLDVRVDDRQRAVRRAPEQVARAGGRLVEERSQDHRLAILLPPGSGLTPRPPGGTTSRAMFELVVNTYTSLKYVHVLSAVVWVGGACTVQAFAIRISATG